MSGEEQQYLLKLQCEKPKPGTSHSKTERMIVELMNTVKIEEDAFLETYYNCEIDKEGVATVTFKFPLELTKLNLERLIDLRFEAQNRIEKAFGIGYGDSAPDEYEVPNVVLWILGLAEPPADKKARQTAKYEFTKIDATKYDEALKANGVLSVSYIKDLEKKKKDDD